MYCKLRRPTGELVGRTAPIYIAVLTFFSCRVMLLFSTSGFTETDGGKNSNLLEGPASVSSVDNRELKYSYHHLRT